MKGVSAIIAMILIVMIVVSLVGMTWTWTTTLFSSISSTATNATTSATTNLGMQIGVVAAKFYASPTSHVNVTIRNRGTNNIDLSKLGIYIDGTLCPVYTPNTGSTAPGSIKEIRITNATAACPNKVVRVTVESGFEDYTTISC